MDVDLAMGTVFFVVDAGGSSVGMWAIKTNCDKSGDVRLALVVS